MTYRSLLRASLAVAGIFLFTSAMPAAEYKEAAHPLCRQDPRDPCVKMTMNFQGASDTTLLVDRIEAKVADTCKVPMNSGALQTASTDSLTLPDVSVKDNMVTRAFWFPKGCNVWFHLREPIYAKADKIVSQTLHLVENITVKVGLSGAEAKDPTMR